MNNKPNRPQNFLTQVSNDIGEQIKKNAEETATILAVLPSVGQIAKMAKDLGGYNL